MSVWDEVGDTAGEKLRSELIDLVHHADASADRSQQRELGPSQIGNPCTRCLAAMILGVYERANGSDPWPAIIGTSVHRWLEKAADRDNRDHDGAWCTEVKVAPHAELLPKGGSVDLYQDTTGTVIDHKVVGAPAQKRYKSSGPGAAYRAQIHLYGLGIANASLPVNRVAIAFWLRGGRTTDLWVWSEPYDEAVAQAALERYRTLRDLCHTAGQAILADLPSDPACFDCTRSNRAQPITALPEREKETA